MKNTFIPFLVASSLLVGVGSMSAAVTATGLVGYYTFDDSTVTDLSGGNFGSASVNTGSWTGASTFGGGYLGGGHAIVGNGAGSNFLTVSGSEYNFGTGSFTVLFWMNQQANVTSDPSIASSGGKNWSSSGISQGWNMAIGGGDDYDANISDGTTRTDPARIDIDPGVNNWALMGLVVDQATSTVSMYALDFNVVTIGDDASAPTIGTIGATGSLTSNGDIVFGQDGDGTGYSIPAFGIDDVSLWNRALDQSEIQEIYTAGRSGNALSTVLIPEPSSLGLLALGALATLRRRRN